MRSGSLDCAPGAAGIAIFAFMLGRCHSRFKSTCTVRSAGIWMCRGFQASTGRASFVFSGGSCTYPRTAARRAGKNSSPSAAAATAELQTPRRLRTDHSLPDWCNSRKKRTSSKFVLAPRFVAVQAFPNATTSGPVEPLDGSRSMLDIWRGLKPSCTGLLEVQTLNDSEKAGKEKNA
jgi:hypothetical protein